MIYMYIMFTLDFFFSCIFSHKNHLYDPLTWKRIKSHFCFIYKNTVFLGLKFKFCCLVAYF